MSEEVSIIYKNIFIYRSVMNLIYGGNYNKRFKKIIGLIDQEKVSSVTELCFGDTIIANYCKEKNILWNGIDINGIFVDRAKKQGYNAICNDIVKVAAFAKSDICIISGSLYHFNHDERLQLFKKMFSASDKVIISEPIKNLSDNKGIIGYIARRSANAGAGNEVFRFNQQSLIAMLEEYKNIFNFEYTISGFVKKDIIVFLKKHI